MSSYKGRFNPKNPEKYLGDVKNIVYRSLLERRFMVWLDKEESIIGWLSEEVIIPYYSPIDKRQHRYFPDFVYKQQKTNNTVETVLVEVKPESQTRAPTPPTDKSLKKIRRYNKDAKVWIVNNCKWDAAQEWCKKNGAKFVIVTEKDIDSISPKTKKK